MSGVFESKRMLYKTVYVLILSAAASRLFNQRQQVKFNENVKKQTKLMCKGPQLREALQKLQNIQSKHYKKIRNENKNDALIAPGGSYQSTQPLLGQVNRVSSDLLQLANLKRSNQGFLWENYFIFVIYVFMCVGGYWGKASQKGLPCAQLVSGWHVQDTQGSCYRQWEGYSGLYPLLISTLRRLPDGPFGSSVARRDS